MNKTIDGTALAAAIVAAGLGFFLLSGPYFWMASIAGLTIAIVLLAYDREGVRSVAESAGFAAVVSLALALAVAAPLAWIRAQNGQNASFAGPVSGEWLPYMWIGLTILLLVIDRARMSGRVSYVAGTPVQPIMLRPTPTPVAPVVSPEPAQQAPSGAAFTRSSFSEMPAEPSATPFAEPEESAAATPETEPAPMPKAIPVPPGKEAMIYVSLVGEGLNVLRAVRAEHLGRDFYKIAEEMPEGETWQFGPGQIVRCRKKSLSSGKAMVAVEEAPRAR